MANNTEHEKKRFPKRRKSKDNPYTIGYDEKHQSYYLTFPNVSGVMQQIYIAKELYEVFDDFELQDLSQLNEQEWHIDAAEIMDDYLYQNLTVLPNVVEEVIEREFKEEAIRKAIKELLPTQRRRLILYYFEGFTYE